MTDTADRSDNSVEPAQDDQPVENDGQQHRDDQGAAVPHGRQQTVPQVPCSLGGAGIGVGFGVRA